MAIGDWRSYVIRKSAATYLGREGFGGTGTNLDSMNRTQLQNLIRAANDRYNPEIKRLEALVATRAKGGSAYNRDKSELDRLKNQRDNQIAPAVQRLKSQKATPKQQNWQQMLKPNVQSTGTQQPATSVVDATRNVPPAPNLPPVQGENPADLAGFARQRGYMGQQTQEQNTPTIESIPLPNVPKQTQQVTQEATQQASQPPPQQKQRTGPPPKRKTTAQLNQEAQQRRLQQSNNPPPPPSDAEGNPIPPKEIPGVNQQLIQEQRKRQDKFLQDMQRTVQRSAKSGRQRRKDAKAQAKQQKQQAKQQARQQKTQQRLAQQQQRQQEREAKRQAKQNPRAGGQLVRRNPDSRRGSRLVPKGQIPSQSRLRQRQPRKIPLAKSDELSKSIKDILRR